MMSEGIDKWILTIWVHDAPVKWRKDEKEKDDD